MMMAGVFVAKHSCWLAALFVGTSSMNHKCHLHNLVDTAYTDTLTLDHQGKGGYVNSAGACSICLHVFHSHSPSSSSSSSSLHLFHFSSTAKPDVIVYVAR